MTTGANPQHIWVIGGSFGSTAFLDVQMLDLDTLTWIEPDITGESVPEPRSRHTANRLGSMIYIFGGGDNLVLYNDVWSLDTETCCWRNIETTGTPPTKRWGHTTTLVDTRLFVFGGHDGSGRLNDIHILDLKTFAWTNPECRAKQAASPRSPTSLALSTSGDDLHSSTSSVATDEAEQAGSISSPSASQASPQASPPVPASKSSTEDNKSIKTNDASSPTNRNQQQQQPQHGLPPARGGHTANCLGRKLIIYGGGDGKLLGDVYYLNVDTLEWSSMESGNVPDRCAHSAEVFQTPQGPRILVFGGSNGIKTFNDLHIVTCGKNKVRQSHGKKKEPFLLNTAEGSSFAAVVAGKGETSPPPVRKGTANGKTSTEIFPALASCASSSGNPSPRQVNAQTTISPRLSYRDVLQVPSTDRHDKVPEDSEAKKAPVQAPPSPTIIVKRQRVASNSLSGTSPRSTEDPPSESKLYVLLKEIGLERLWPIFTEQEITLDQVPSLNDSHLQSLGLKSIREKALMAKLKERAAHVLAELSRSTGSSTASQNISNGYHQRSLPSQASASLGLKASELVLQVQMSTDALAVAADSLRNASQAVLAEK